MNEMNYPSESSSVSHSTSHQDVRYSGPRIKNIAVVGTGYVGLVTGTYFANHGLSVTCLDISAERISKLKEGQAPFFEPGLDEYTHKALNKNKLTFTTDYSQALKEAEVVFICVGTPPKNGDADMSFVESALKSTCEGLDHDAVIVGKSTMPFGIKDWVLNVIKDNKKENVKIDWVVNPEFLSEGTAILDMESPSRVIIGGEDEEAVEKVVSLYKDVTSPIIRTDVESAALIKYASNSFLATKISFVNSLANVADKLGGDVTDIIRGMGLDPRIGSRYLRPGIGFGGSCLPKDIQAFYLTAEKHGSHFDILKVVEEINLNQTKVIVEKLKAQLDTLTGKKIALLGLAFKQDTDDIRESPGAKLVNFLIEDGALVVGTDPEAMPNFRKLNLEMQFADEAYQALKGADALVLVTEWEIYFNLDWQKVKDLMNEPVVIDGRNFLDKAQLKSLGFKYTGVGTR